MKFKEEMMETREITPRLWNGPLYRAFMCWAERGWVFVSDQLIVDSGYSIEKMCELFGGLSEDVSVHTERHPEDCYYKINIVMEQYNLFGWAGVHWRDT